MQGKTVNFNPESGKRLSAWLKEVGMTQIELAEHIHYTQQYLSAVVTGKKNMSSNLAEAISAAAVKPVFNSDGVQIGFNQVRSEYLLCKDDIKTKDDYPRLYVSRADAVNDSCMILLESSLREVCLRENLPIPTIDSIPEMLFLTAQLRDYSDSLMWNYVKWKHNSHVWGLLEQIKDATERRKSNG